MAGPRSSATADLSVVPAELDELGAEKMQCESSTPMAPTIARYGPMPPCTWQVSMQVSTGGTQQPFTQRRLVDSTLSAHLHVVGLQLPHGVQAPLSGAAGGSGASTCAASICGDTSRASIARVSTAASAGGVAPPRWLRLWNASPSITTATTARAIAITGSRLLDSVTVGG